MGIVFVGFLANSQAPTMITSRIHFCIVMPSNMPWTLLTTRFPTVDRSCATWSIVCVRARGGVRMERCVVYAASSGDAWLGKRFARPWSEATDLLQRLVRFRWSAGGLSTGASRSRSAAGFKGEGGGAGGSEGWRQRRVADGARWELREIKQEKKKGAGESGVDKVSRARANLMELFAA